MAQAPKKENDAGTAPAPKKKLFMLIGLALALVAISVGGTVVALKMFAPQTNEQPAAEAAAPTPTLAPAIYLEMTPNFTINFAVNGRQRYLQAALTLLYRDPALESLLNLHMPAIRNGLVMLFSSKDFDQLQTPEGKEQLKLEALEVIQGLLKKEQDALIASGKTEGVSTATVEQVLFTNFVMQ